MSLAVPSTLFGLPLSLQSDEARRLTKFLELAWWSNYSRSIKMLDDDLKAMRQYFDPIATGRKLREQVSAVSRLPDAPSFAVDVGGLVVPLWENRFLIRPEGRVALEILQEAKLVDKHVVIEQRMLLAATQQVFEVYRALSMQRLEDVVGLLTGQEPLQAQPLGVVLWLLINRCTAPDRAIHMRSVSPEYSTRIDEALRPPVEAFIANVSKTSSPRERRELSLYSAWQITEAARRLGPRLVTGASIYLAKDQEEQVIRVIVADLRRRRNLDLEQLRNALNAFYTAFRITVPQLAALGVYFELPHETRRMIAEIERLFITEGDA